LHTFPDFKQLIELTSQQKVNYNALAKTLSARGKEYENLMIIKPAYREWTTLLNAEKLTVVISKTMALTRDIQQPLTIDVSSAGGKEAIPKAILLYAHTIPFELTIHGANSFPSFISMLPGDTIHQIEKVTMAAPSPSFDTMLKTFNPISPKSHKIFWIKSFVTKNDKNADLLVKNVVMDTHDNKIYYTREGKRYFYPYNPFAGINIQEITEDYTKKYQEIIDASPDFQNELIEQKKIAEIRQTLERKIKEKKEKT
jgi:hypothetical protein